MNPPDAVGTHDVYRCFDADGVLLYVGCSFDAEWRISQHMDICYWSNPVSAYLAEHMTRWEFETYPTKREALAAEKAAIQDGAPLLNVHHNKGRGLKRETRGPATLEEMREALEKVADALGMGAADAPHSADGAA